MLKPLKITIFGPKLCKKGISTCHTQNKDKCFLQKWQKQIISFPKLFTLSKHHIFWLTYKCFSILWWCFFAKKGHFHPQQLSSACKQNWKLGDTKINFASLIPLQMTKFQKFWIPEYFLYQSTLLIKIQPKREVLLFSLQSFLSLHNNHTLLDNLPLQSTAKETSHIASFI